MFHFCISMDNLLEQHVAYMEANGENGYEFYSTYWAKSTAVDGFHVASGMRLAVLTNADRSLTTILQP